MNHNKFVNDLLNIQKVDLIAIKLQCETYYTPTQLQTVFKNLCVLQSAVQEVRNIKKKKEKINERNKEADNTTKEINEHGSMR